MVGGQTLSTLENVSQSFFSKQTRVYANLILILYDNVYTNVIFIRDVHK